MDPNNLLEGIGLVLLLVLTAVVVIPGVFAMGGGVVPHEEESVRETVDGEWKDPVGRVRDEHPREFLGRLAKLFSRRRNS